MVKVNGIVFMVLKALKNEKNSHIKGAANYYLQKQDTLPPGHIMDHTALAVHAQACKSSAGLPSLSAIWRRQSVVTFCV